MMDVRQWVLTMIEWLLVGLGVGCLGMFAFETVEARRFQAERAAEFARAAQAYAPVTVRAGGLVGMLDVPRLRLTAPVIEGDDDATLKRAAGQVRAGIGGVYALDFGAVLMLADAMGALNTLLVELLPEIEPIVVRAYAPDSD